MTNAHRPRKSPPECERREDEQPTCSGRADVILVGPGDRRQRVCPAHAAALWLTEPHTWHFAANTRSEAIADVMRQAFGGRG